MRNDKLCYSLKNVHQFRSTYIVLRPLLQHWYNETVMKTCLLRLYYTYFHQNCQTKTAHHFTLIISHSSSSPLLNSPTSLYHHSLVMVSVQPLKRQDMFFFINDFQFGFKEGVFDNMMYLFLINTVTRVHHDLLVLILLNCCLSYVFKSLERKLLVTVVLHC